MPIYSDSYLPTEEELTVQEVNLTTAHLFAAAHHIGKSCDEQSKEFMLCRAEEKDPRKCIEEGKAVTSCAIKFLQKVKALCRDEFEQYAHCVDYSSKNFCLTKCRKTQAVYDACIFENLGQERPPLGFFSKIRVHSTKRPKPIEPKQEFPDTPDRIPDDYPREPARYGSRFYFVN